jgi:hypothetical protein
MLWKIVQAGPSRNRTVDILRRDCFFPATRDIKELDRSILPLLRTVKTEKFLQFFSQRSMLC